MVRRVIEWLLDRIFLSIDYSFYIGFPVYVTWDGLVVRVSGLYSPVPGVWFRF